MAKYLFFQMPKTGSTFLHSLLREKLGKKIKIEGHHRLYEENKILIKGINDADLWKFCFVRNPYTRFISAYRYLVAPQKFSHKNDIKEKKAILKYQNLSEFCHNLEEFTSNPDNFPIHFYPQHKWITDWDGNLTMDYTGKFETMNESWRLICAHLSIDYQPIYQKQSQTIIHLLKNRLFDFFQRYDQVFPLIYDFYRKDFELFGYDQDVI